MRYGALRTILLSVGWMTFVGGVEGDDGSTTRDVVEINQIDTGEIRFVSESQLHEASFAAKGSAACACGKAQSGASKGCDCAGLAKAVAGSHKGVFYANDFGYLCNPCYEQWHLGDRMKRIGLGDCWTADVGGQYRMRLHDERNIRNTPAVPNGLGLTGNDDRFLLHRTRFYLNAEYGQNFRFYGELLDAVSNYENTLPRVIEENRMEMQNLFVELRGYSFLNGTIGTRIGRQELLYGAQRLVSPLDWANTRRTFDAAKVMYEGANWDIDGLFGYLLRRDVTRLDPPHQDRQLYGVYASYKNLCRDSLELYWLALDFNDVGFRYDTIGTRYWGGRDNWLYEFEGNFQFGQNADNTSHSAGSVTAGIGRKFSAGNLNPTIWAYYDWASGSDTVGNGYHHYQPLAHKYNGFMDLFGRRNLEDFNLLATADLTCRTKFLFWYHYFTLANGNDVPYNVNMSPFAGLPAGSSRQQRTRTRGRLSGDTAANASVQRPIGVFPFLGRRLLCHDPGCAVRRKRRLPLRSMAPQLLTAGKSTSLIWHHIPAMRSTSRKSTGC